jgi:phosphoesterase RecJ-like protein
MNNTDFKNAFKIISGAETFAIVGHIRPDGDCIGGALAMKFAVESLGKSAQVFIDGEIPEQFFYLKGIDTINTNPRQFFLNPSQFDLLIILDSSSQDRLGAFSDLDKYAKSVLCIDHHLENSIKADLYLVNPDRASAGEILYELFTENGIEITPDMATALYTSVSTDTGCFLYANTTSFSHRVTAELLEKGVDIERVNYYNFRVYGRNVIAGFRQVLNSLTFTHNGEIALAVLRKSRKVTFNHEERHRIQKYASDAKGVRLSVFLTEETRGNYHVSLRSHGDINVATAAIELGGGGHKNAAGFVISGKYKAVVEKILHEVEKLL